MPGSDLDRLGGSSPHTLRDAPLMEQCPDAPGVDSLLTKCVGTSDRLR